MMLVVVLDAVAVAVVEVRGVVFVVVGRVVLGEGDG